jgi:hypothetical protein
MTVTVHQRPSQETRSSGKSCKWVAEAIVNGRTYTATSRMAPANDIARQLVADNVPDAPMHVYTEGLTGCLVWAQPSAPSKRARLSRRTACGGEPLPLKRPLSLRGRPQNRG